MKTTEAKPGTTTAQKATPFFSSEKKQGFFDSDTAPQAFFNGGALQPKLTVGKPNDPYEKEADAVADKVVQRLAAPETASQNVSSTPSLAITPLVQTKCAACEAEEKLQQKEDTEAGMTDELQLKPIFESNAEPPDDPDSVQRKCAACEKEEQLRRKENHGEEAVAPSSVETRLGNSASHGAPLPKDVNESMSQAFSTDFSDVRIHDDSGAAQLNKDLHAQAFTHGRDIYFDSGKYDATSESGKRLLAHELTHVVQQGKSNGNTGQRKIQRVPEWLSSASDWVSDTASATVDAATEGAEWVGGKVVAGATAVKEVVEEGVAAIYEEIKGLIDSGIEWLNEKWTALKEFASSGFDAAKNAFTNIVTFIKSPFNLIASAIMNFDETSLTAAWAMVTGLINGIWEGFKALTDNLLEKVNSIWEGISGFATSLLKKVAGLTQNFLFKKLPDAVQRIAKALVDQLQSLWESISSGWTKIFKVIKKWVDDAIDTVLQFVLKVASFGMHVIVQGIIQFGKLVMFMKDLFTNPKKYINILAAKSVAAFAGVEGRFEGVVQQYFQGGKNAKPEQAAATGTIQKQPNPGAPAEVKTSASWSDIGTGILKMMGLKWNEFKSNPWSVVIGLLVDMFFPIYGNIKDIIQLFKDIWKIVTGPLSAGSLEEVWTSLLKLLDIPILIYHTVISILMRSLMVPLIVASFIPHPLVKGIAAAVGYALLGGFVEAELLNIGHKLLLLKTGATNQDEKNEAYNRIADSLIAMAMTAVIIIIMLILHFIANVMKGIYNFVKGKVFDVKSVVPEGKAAGEGKGEGKVGPEEGKGSSTEPPKLEGEVGSKDGQRSVKVTEKGKIWICASPCEEIRLKYEAQIKENPQFEQRIKALEEGYPDLTNEQKTLRDAEIKQLEQELADAKLAKEGGVRAPKEVKWPPEAPKGEKPAIDAPDAAEWRYQRYVFEKAQEGKGPKDVLPPDEWMRRYFDPAAEGGRPGRPGGPEQVAAKKALAGEGIEIVENVEIGGRYPDGVDPNPNPQGGKGYFEVGKMLESGIPEARERVKIADEIKAMGPNDTVTFVDKTDVSRRVTYAKGSTPESPTSRTFVPKKK